MNDVVIPEEVRKEVSTLEEWTKSVSVTSAGQRLQVYQAVQSVKTKKKEIVDFFAESKAAAAAAHRAICANEKTFTDKLDAFERAGKAAIMAYDRAEEDKRLAEQRRLQAIADEQARKERAKAEAEAAEQRRKEAEARAKAEEARRAAETADKAERERLLKEAQKADLQAAAAQAKAEVKAETAAAVVAPVIEIKAPEKQEGESVRKVWKAKIIDANLIPPAFLASWIDPKKVDDFALTTKGAMKIPGVEFYAENSMAVRTKTF